MSKIGIIMGSDSDLKVMSQAAQILADFNIEYEIAIISAHRTPDRLYEYAKNASSRGIKLIIAGAGGAAHLPGMVASLTTVPVIGVPVKTNALSGLDSLYSIVQMPSGIPVATMAINGAKNAGILAAQILGIFNSEISEKCMKFRADLKEEIVKKSHMLEESDYNVYINQHLL